MDPGISHASYATPTLCVPTLLSQLSPPEDPELLDSFTHMGDDAVTSNITEYFLGQSHLVFTRQPAWVTAGLRTQERNLESCSPHPHQSSHSQTNSPNASLFLLVILREGWRGSPPAWCCRVWSLPPPPCLPSSKSQDVRVPSEREAPRWKELSAWSTAKSCSNSSPHFSLLSWLSLLAPCHISVLAQLELALILSPPICRGQRGLSAEMSCA